VQILAITDKFLVEMQHVSMRKKTANIIAYRSLLLIEIVYPLPRNQMTGIQMNNICDIRAFSNNHLGQKDEYIPNKAIKTHRFNA
jgi:hypothetical protein